MIEPRSARERTNAEDKTNPELLAMYCRISAEIGADIVKCIYPGNVEALRTVVQGCPAPLLVAGGAKADNPRTLTGKHKARWRPALPVLSSEGTSTSRMSLRRVGSLPRNRTWR